MAKSSGHYSGWVKRDAVSGRYTGPLGATTTPQGHTVVRFAKPGRINEKQLERALSGAGESAPRRRGASS